MNILLTLTVTVVVACRPPPSVAVNKSVNVVSDVIDVRLFANMMWPVELTVKYPEKKSSFFKFTTL